MNKVLTTKEFLRQLHRLDEACIYAAQWCEGGTYSEELDSAFRALAQFVTDSEAEAEEMYRILEYWVKTRRCEN